MTATWQAPDTQREDELVGVGKRDAQYGMLLRYEKARPGTNFHDHDGWHVLSHGCYVGGRKHQDKGWSYEEALRVYERHLAEKQYRDWLPIAEAMSAGYERGRQHERTSQRALSEQQPWWKLGGKGQGTWPNEPTLGPCPKCGTLGPDKTKCQTCG